MTTRTSTFNASALAEYQNDLLGQIYPPDDQCEAIDGHGSYMCRVGMDVLLLKLLVFGQIKFV